MRNWTLPARALGLGLLLSVAGAADALPVTVYADGTTSYGFDPADVQDAIDAGANEPTGVTGLTGLDLDGDGDDDIRVTTPDGISGVKGKDKSNPSKGSSIWTLSVDAETPAELIQNFCLVILGHDPNDPFKYKTGNVGLEIDTEVPWTLVEPANGGPTYVAFVLGDLAPGGSYEIPIEYRVGQKLKKKNGTYWFPRYAIATLSVSVPEPSTLALGFAGLAAALLARRKR